MRILLIKPGRIGTVGLDRTALVEPLGLEMVAASIPEHEVRIVDLRLQNDLAVAVAEFQPQAVGVGCSFTTEVYRSREIAREVKERMPDCFVFVGGHHPSLCPEDFADDAVDAIVIGEAERTVPVLLAALQDDHAMTQVAGLCLNVGGRQHMTQPRAPVADLDQLPFPARQLVARRGLYYMGFHRPHALVETARGCPYRCKFCSVWKFYGGRVRRKGAERVVAELEQVSAPHVFFTDDNFLSDVDRAHQIADLLRQRGIRKSYTFQARADTIAHHADLLSHWRDVGRISVFVGVEKIDEDELSGLNKRSSVADNEQAITILKDLGVGFSCNFIVAPEAEKEDFARLRDYVCRWGLHGASYSVLTPLPGTDLYEEMKDQFTTSDYELFDLCHAVTETKLPLDEFYQEFASLWAASRAAGSSVRGYRAWKLVKALLTGRTSLSNLRLGMNMAKRLSDPRNYLAAHQAPNAQAPSWRAQGRL